MSRAKKVLLRTGIYSPPQGELRVNAARLKHYADSFAQMKALGIKIPIAWGHIPEAVPGDASQRAAQQYYLSAFNAGYLDSLDTDGSDLASVLNCPGCELDPATGNLLSWVKLPDGRQVRTAIGEVSVAIKDWRDGQGRLWPDVITHVALTPLPVMAGQEGFAAALSTLAPADSQSENGRVYYLSTLTPVRELSAAEDDEMPDDTDFDEGKKLGEEEGNEEMPPDESAAEVPPVTPESPAAEPPPAPPGDNAGRLSEAIQTLNAHGLHLPPDTTLDNILERICVAGHAHKTGAEGAARDAQGNEEEEEEDGATYSGEEESPAGGNTVQEERPVMMSLATAKTPTERKLIEREQEQHRKRQLRLIDKLVKKGMPVHEAEGYRSRLSSYTLSLTEEGEVSPKKIDFELSTWSKALAHSAFGKDVLGEATREHRPAIDEDSRNKAQEDAGDELAARATGRK